MGGDQKTSAGLKKFSLQVRPEAEADLRQGYQWYEA